MKLMVHCVRNLQVLFRLILKVILLPGDHMHTTYTNLEKYRIPDLDKQNCMECSLGALKVARSFSDYFYEADSVSWYTKQQKMKILSLQFW